MIKPGRSRLPKIRKLKKAEFLSYELNGDEMPITNPAEHKTKLDKLFKKSNFCQEAN